MDPAVELVAISKGFGRGEEPAVSEVSLAVQPGETVALLGPSGSGKTTLLRLVAGFLEPDAGVVRLAGREVARPGRSVPPERRGVGMVFQDYALFPHLTVSRNVSFGLNGLPKRARQEAVGRVLELVDLQGLQHRYPHELSGGQQQRVALARALAPRPIVILLDEPFSSLDASLRAQVREDVATILHDSGSTALFVTHDQDEALFLGDRVAVLRAGRLEQVATPEDVYHRPASRFVAEFLGKTDFLPGRVTADGVSTELGLLPQQLACPSGTEVHVAIRPDDVRFAPDPASSARVVMRHFEGTTALYHVALPSGDVVHSLQPHTLLLQPGSAVSVWVDAGHDLPCFDSDGQTVPEERPSRADRTASRRSRSVARRPNQPSS
jgi:iron(III) transport system ATP-binding protein